ncbi:MAG: hypothetical protein QNJ00_18340 [Woeseiaceae bacterium]|nr:hypothetical protein [Woeseiaceae bacterium]
MKSILVDALRAANEDSADSPSEDNRGEESGVKLDDSARLDRATLDAASNDGADAAPSADELELLEPGEPAAAESAEATGAELTLGDADGPEGPEDFALSETMQIDATDAEEPSPPPPAAQGPVDASPAPPLPSKPAPIPISDRLPAASFERAGVWAPAVCLCVGLAAAAAFSGWSIASGTTGNHDLRLLTEQGYAQGSVDLDMPATRSSRFEFISPSEVRPAPIEPPVANDSRKATVDASGPVAAVTPTSIIRRSAPRSATPAGSTMVDENTFSSLPVAYRAYRNGEIGAYEVDRIVAAKIESGDSQTEIDLKLLLQRYPESVRLHRALGTLLAAESRWPEAEVAFARASELSAGGEGTQ